MDAPLNFDRHNNFDRLNGAKPAQEEYPDLFNISELVEQVSGFVRRQLPIFLFVVPCSLALGFVYYLTASPSFTSHATLLIDSSNTRILQQQQPIGDVPIDTAQVETQVEILKSENIGLSVVKELNLNDDPEFTGSKWGLISKLLSFLPAGQQQQSEANSSRRALEAFLNKRVIARVGRTYVLDIAFTSLSPARAAAVANAIADAYIVDQLESKYKATKRASVWLQDRIKELRQQASDADRAVLDYKEKNKIVSVGGNSATGNTRLLGEQQVEDLNTQLGSARAGAEEAKARLDRITEVLRKEAPGSEVPGTPVDATVADTLHNEVINRLRTNYLDLAGKEAIWSARYGSNHLAAVNLRTQMAEIRRSILDELGRIAEGYKSDYEIAKSRVEGLERELQKLVATSQVTNRDRLGLTDLESTAKVYHTIYDNFLQRYMEAIQQQSFPITEARVITAAVPPQRKSGPVGHVVLGAAAIIGLFISFGVAMMREAVDRVFRTSRQVETTLQANCIAVLPRLNEAPTKVSAFDLIRARTSRERAAGLPKLAPDHAGSELQPRIVNVGLTKADQSVSTLVSRNSTGSNDKVISGSPTFMNQVVRDPLSAFAEAFRVIKVAADISCAHLDNKVIGITSTVAGEGKSTVSSNLAQLIAHAGKRVILLDGDLRNPSVTRALAPNARQGLLQVLNDSISLDDAIYVDEATGLNFIPTVLETRIAHTNEILASGSFGELVERLRKSYDYIIVDFPPVAPVVDVRTTSQIVDRYIYVVEWGKTPMSLVQHKLLGCPEIYERLLGVVLNKANVSVLERYEQYYGKYYHKNYYLGQYPYST